jgi:CHASE3 domain sensor protein
LRLQSNAEVSAAVALDFVLSGEEDYLVKFHSTLNVEKEHWQALLQSGADLFDPGSLVDELRLRIDNSQAFSKRLVQLRQDAALAEVQTVMESVEGQTLQDALDSTIERLDESLRLKLQERRTKVKS